MKNVPTIQLQTGYNIPQIGLGTWKSEPGQVRSAVECALEAGYRHVDCAYIYNNENEVGQAIQAKIKEGVVTRKDLFITSKLWNEHHDPAKVEEALKLSLEALQLDYLDLYLMHWPMAWKKVEIGGVYKNYVDDMYNFVDTYKAMEKLVDAGLVRSLGLSNFNSLQIQAVLDQCTIKPAMIQVEIHPYLSNEKLVQFCQKQGLVVTASSPFASPDKARATYKDSDPSPMEDAVIKDIGKKHDKSAAQVILRWLIQRNIIIIPKSITPSRIQSNIELFDFSLTDEDMKAVSNLNRNFRCCDIFPESKYYPFGEEF